MDNLIVLLFTIVSNLGKNYNYVVFVVVMVSALGIIIIRTNLLQKIIGLSLLQSSLFIFFISMGYIKDRLAPIVVENMTYQTYLDFVNPLPQAIVLTAIVVGLATTAVACCLVIRIKEDLKSMDEEELYK